MRKKKRAVLAVIGEVLMLCLCAIFFIPFYYLLVNTFKTAKDATFSPLSLPITGFTLDNYKKALDTINFLRSLSNSVIITILSVIIIILFGSMAAYTITRRKNRVTKVLLVYFLIGFMVPVQTTMIPLFKLMSNLHLTNSIWGMIVLYSSWCNFAMFMYQGFLGTVPQDLEDAAFIDGCDPFRVFRKIVFPLLKPVTTTIIIFDVMWIWNDFMLPYLFVGSSKNFTLIMEVYKGVGEFSNNWTTMLCTMVIVLIPITIFYCIMQKHIIAGITSGAVKG